MNAPADSPPIAYATCATCGRKFNPQDEIKFGERSVCPRCKDSYAQALREGIEHEALAVGPNLDLRRRHLKHETSIRAMGVVHEIFGILLLFVGILFLDPEVTEEDYTMVLPYAILTLFYALVAAIVGDRLWRLKPRARITGIFIAAPGILLFPFGTLVSAYTLYLLLSESGKHLFSDEYQHAVAATTGIKYQYSRFLLFVLITTLLSPVLIGIVAYLLLAPRHFIYVPF